MLPEPPPSRPDIRFRLFRIPIRIHPGFWVVAALLGWTLPIVEQVLWVVVVFASILAHELGHALSARASGKTTHVVLYSMGGLTIFDEAMPVRLRWNRALIAVSGPLAGFMLAGLAHLSLPVLGPTESGILGALYFHLVWVNIAWGMVNLLPVWPLDGGQVARALLVEFAGDTGFSISSLVSVVVAGGMAFAAWQVSQPIIAMFFAYFAYREFESTV